jgi:hypothetical protein
MASVELGFDTPSSVSRTLGGEQSSPSTGPEYLSTRTFVKSQKAHNPEDCERWEEAEAMNTLSPRDGSAPSVLVFTQNQRDELRDLGNLAGSLSGEGSHQTNYLVTSLTSPLAWGATFTGNDFSIERDLSPPMRAGADRQNTMPLTFSVEASPVRTSPSPESEPGLQELGPDSSTSTHESLSLFDLAGFSSRTYPDCSPRTAVGTSESCLERWPTSGTAWRGGLSTAVSSECRSDEGGCSSSEPSLSQILEEPQNVPAKYSLSARAAQGILRRAEKRGRTLPQHLADALQAVSMTKEAVS